jgi:hypothetical protein
LWSTSWWASKVVSTGYAAPSQSTIVASYDAKKKAALVVGNFLGRKHI